jgi:tRNA 2-thiouridine synthesizing protein E
MGTITVAGRSIEVDEAGYLVNRADWSEDIAKKLARLDNCELTDKHWEIIKPARAYYEKRQVTPSLYVLTKAMREKHGVGNDNLDHLLQILARLNVKRVFQYAGLPPKNTIHVSGKRIALGDRGNLKDPSDWSEDVAKALAMADDYELTKKHWDTIYRLRRFYEKHHTAQSMDAATAALREWLGLEFELRSSLRPRQALKYAGLPDLLVPHPRNIDVSGRRVELDGEGYLVNPSDWSEDVTKELAWLDNCELTDNHWEVINSVRDCYYHEEFQISPPVCVLIEAIGRKLGHEKGNVKYLYTLFPYGPAKRACKYAIKRVLQYAGLPPKNTIRVPGRRIALDEGGNLKDPSDWCEGVVRALAKADSFELTKKHWDTVYRLRQCYEKHRATQSMDAATTALHEWLGLEFEFRSSLRLGQALKYAGLPDLLVPYPRTIIVSGRRIELDEEGYLINRADWDEEIAEEIARRDNFELTPEHWEVIHFLRDFYEEHQYTPHTRMLPKVIEKKLGTNKGNNKYLYGLFPYGPFKQGCKYAGLPRIVGTI